MSNTENQIIKLKGLVKWASVPPNPARKPPTDYINPLAPNDASYSVEVECTKEKYDKLIKAGIPRLTALKADEENGKTYIRIKAAKVRRVNGEDVSFSDPFVVDKAGNHFDQAIGNGSEAIVVAELVNLKKGKALRLKGIQVLNHVSYTPKSGVNKYKDQLEIDTSSSNNQEETLDDFL